MKQGLLKTVQPNGTWNSQHGLMYQFELVIECEGEDITGEANSKSQEPPYAEGEQVWFEVSRETQYGKKLKVSTKPPYQGGGGGGGYRGGKDQDRIGNQWAIRDAIQVLISRGDEVTYQSIADVARELIRMRDNLETYLA